MPVLQTEPVYVVQLQPDNSYKLILVAGVIIIGVIGIVALVALVSGR